MEERNCPMEDPFAFLTLDFLKKSEIFPGSLGTFRYRFQRTGKVNDGTIRPGSMRISVLKRPGTLRRRPSPGRRRAWHPCAPG